MRPWAVLLAGPSLWFAHFMVVYVAVEAGCAAKVGAAPLMLGLSGLALFTLATTAVAAGASLVVGLHAHRARRDDGDRADAWAVASLLLGVLFAFAIVLVGVPALWVDAC